MTIGNQAADGSTRVTIANVDAGTVNLSVDTSAVATEATLAKLVGWSYSRKTADGQVKGSAGILHSITVSPTTATPTAGLVTVYDSASESGTAIFSEWVFATTPAHTVILDVTCGTGIYIGYDATLANVSVTAAYQ